MEEDIQFAIENIPTHLKRKISFQTFGIEEFPTPEDSDKFDIALFTWSL
jgi:hypothetical protein